MTKIVEFNPSAVPSFVKRGELSAMAKALAGGGVGGGKRISIKGGVFRLISDGKEVASIEDRYLDVVMVNAAPKVGRTFYLKKYDAENPAAPDCWSADGNVPDPTAENKQSTSCVTCPQNIAGSGEGTSRACRFSQRIAVVLANDVEGDVMQISLPAQSIFGKEEGDNRPLQAYARYMAAQGAGADQVVTRLRFDTNAATPKMFFKAMRWLTEEEYEIAQRQGQTKEAIDAITMTVAQVDKVAAPDAAIAGAPPKAKAKPAPVVEVAEEEEEAPPPPPKAKKAKAAPAPAADEDEEPAVRKEAPAETKVPARASALSAIVGAWDDSDD